MWFQHRHPSGIALPASLTALAAPVFLQCITLIVAADLGPNELVAVAIASNVFIYILAGFSYLKRSIITEIASTYEVNIDATERHVFFRYLIASFFWGIVVTLTLLMLPTQFLEEIFPTFFNPLVWTVVETRGLGLCFAFAYLVISGFLVGVGRDYKALKCTVLGYICALIFILVWRSIDSLTVSALGFSFVFGNLTAFLCGSYFAYALTYSRGKPEKRKVSTSRRSEKNLIFFTRSLVITAATSYYYWMIGSNSSELHTQGVMVMTTLSIAIGLYTGPEYVTQKWFASQCKDERLVSSHSNLRSLASIWLLYTFLGIVMVVLVWHSSLGYVSGEQLFSIFDGKVVLSLVLLTICASASAFADGVGIGQRRIGRLLFFAVLALIGMFVFDSYSSDNFGVFSAIGALMSFHLIRASFLLSLLF